MKTFRPLLRKTITWVNITSIVFFLFAFQGCGEDAVTSCTGCPASSPYSVAGSGNNCYATLADCQNALGSGCVFCQ